MVGRGPGRIMSDASVACPSGQLSAREVRDGVQHRGGRERQRWRCVLSDNSYRRFPRRTTGLWASPVGCSAEHYRRFGSFSCGWRVVRPRMFPAPFTMMATSRTRLNGHVSYFQKMRPINPRPTTVSITRYRRCDIFIRLHALIICSLCCVMRTEVRISPTDGCCQCCPTDSSRRSPHLLILLPSQQFVGTDSAAYPCSAVQAGQCIRAFGGLAGAGISCASLTA